MGRFPSRWLVMSQCVSVTAHSHSSATQASLCSADHRGRQCGKHNSARCSHRLQAAAAASGQLLLIVLSHCVGLNEKWEVSGRFALLKNIKMRNQSKEKKNLKFSFAATSLSGSEF